MNSAEQTNKMVTEKKTLQTALLYCDGDASRNCCVGGSTRERGGLGGVLYSVCTGFADRVRLCTCPTQLGTSTAQMSCLL